MAEEAVTRGSPYSRSREQCRTGARAVVTPVFLSCASMPEFVPTPEISNTLVFSRKHTRYHNDIIEN